MQKWECSKDKNMWPNANARVDRCAKILPQSAQDIGMPVKIVYDARESRGFASRLVDGCGMEEGDEAGTRTVLTLIVDTS